MEMRNAASVLAGNRRQRSETANGEGADDGTPLTPAAVLARSVQKHGRGLGAAISACPATILAQSIDRLPADANERAVSTTFWALWLAHRDDLSRHSLRLLGGNNADADDALSEAMVRAAQ